MTNDTGLICNNTPKLNELKKRQLQLKDENIICQKRSKTVEYHKISEKQEDYEFLKNLNNDRNLLDDIEEECITENIKDQKYTSYCYRKKPIWEDLFIFISTILNNIISIFEIDNVEKVVYERDNVEKYLYLNCKQVLYCFWAINTYSKDDLQIRDLKIIHPIIKPKNLMCLLYVLKDVKSSNWKILNHNYYWNYNVELDGYDLKSKIKYLLMNFSKLKRYKSLFRESILILLFCYEIPENFHLSYKKELINNVVARLILLTEVIRRTDRNEFNTTFTKNLKTSINRYQENLCNYRLSSRSKSRLNMFKCNIIKKIQNGQFHRSIDIVKYWNIFSLLRSDRTHLCTHIRALVSEHNGRLTKYQDFLIHFLSRIDKLIDRVLQ